MNVCMFTISLHSDTANIRNNIHIYTENPLGSSVILNIINICYDLYLLLILPIVVALSIMKLILNTYKTNIC